ncbi:putative ferric-chelate reductase 1 homolog [Chironomus tepperi]|uniref:putative ferric-chelate reductase 1 homolog n=1 Tax=Chironomus tepperi TaxID=113505 RepID=UPI00391F7EFE
MNLIHIVFIITAQINLLQCLPQGAPQSACSTLMPIHGNNIPALTSEPLFRISPQSDVLGQRQKMRVEINSVISDLTIKGFMIQARSLQDGSVIGEFSPPQDRLTKTIDCGNVGNTATHSSTELKRNVVLEWNAPTDFIGDIVFNSTLAQDYDKFWVGVTSSPLRIVADDQEITNSISTTRQPLKPTYSYTTKPTAENSNNEDMIYNGCGNTKTCFGVPSNCVQTRSCASFTAVKVEGDKYVFEMRSPPRAAYIATGLSSDDKMGDDSVVECIYDSGSVRAMVSHTIVANGKFDAPRSGVPQNIVQLREGRFENGMIYCQVERPAVTRVNNVVFDLSKNTYYLLMASGSGLRAGSVDYHDINRAASSSALNLAEVANITAKSKFLLRFHGSLMVLTWIGSTSIAIVMARYFKLTWRRSSMCGKDLWFAWHQLLVIITIVLSAVAFIVIFIEFKGWSPANTIHSYLGVTTTAICFLQALIGFSRPSPSSKNRPLFNWVHWFCGNAAHILSIVTIFTSVKLEKAELPSDVFDVILVSYVVIHVIAHLLFSLMGCLSDRKDAQKVTSLHMTDMSQSPRTQMIASVKQDASYAPFRKFILAIYAILIILIVISLIVLIVLAPVKDFKSLFDFNKS